MYKMRNRPLSLILLALIQMATPIGTLLLTAYMGGVSLPRAIEIFARSAGAVEWSIVVVLPFGLSFALWYATRWTFFLSLAACALVAWLNLREWTQATEIADFVSFKDRLLLGVTMTLNLGLVGYLLHPKIREVFLNPRVRWWQSLPRYFVDIKARVAPLGPQAGRSVDASIKDISIGGVGIELPYTDAEVIDNSPWKQGDLVLVVFSWAERTIAMRGEVAYRRVVFPMHGFPTPTGVRFGVRWIANSTEDNQRVLQMVRTLKVSGMGSTASLRDKAGIGDRLRGIFVGLNGTRG